MARFFQRTSAAPWCCAFIEYMDVGATNGWRMDEVLPSAEVVQRIAAVFRSGGRGERPGRRRSVGATAMAGARSA